MTVFPSLTPAERLLIPGDVPREVFTAANGRVATLRRSNGRTGDRLQLRFQGLTSTEAHDLAGHAAGHGQWRRFALPSSVWVATTDPTPSGSSWTYASSPSIEEPPGMGDVSGGYHNAAVELRLQPLPAHA
jgi:hypothetical protein